MGYACGGEHAGESSVVVPFEESRCLVCEVLCEAPVRDEFCGFDEACVLGLVARVQCVVDEVCEDEKFARGEGWGGVGEGPGVV